MDNGLGGGLGGEGGMDDGMPFDDLALKEMEEGSQKSSNISIP